MGNNEREIVGDWFEFVTDNVVITLLSALVALGAVFITGTILLMQGIAHIGISGYNCTKKRRA